jgi:hypothetical protein
VLSRSDALPGDKWLACLCSAVHIAEEVAIVFNMDDPSTSISFTETKTQYHLKAFERQLALWKQSVPRHIDKRLVDHLYGSINVYIHEIAIHHDHNVDDFRPEVPSGANNASGGFVTTAHIDALTACLDSAHLVLNSYLKFDIETCRSLPNLYIVWNTYAEVALIKLHGVLHAPDSNFGSIFAPDLRVDYYLDAISAKLKEVSANNRWPPAEAFIFVTKKLRSWHTHKRAPYLDETPMASQAERQPISDEQGLARMIKALPRATNLPETWGQSATDVKKWDIPPASNTQTGTIDAEMFGASQTSDLNAAFNASNYNIDWNELNFSQSELNIFDNYMNDSGWMGYLM